MVTTNEVEQARDALAIHVSQLQARQADHKEATLRVRQAGRRRDVLIKAARPEAEAPKDAAATAR